MPNSIDYRQSASSFRSRLNAIASRTSVGKNRIYVDSSGNRTRRQPTQSMEEKLKYYGERRYHSVARILALFEMVRRTERLGRPVLVESTGAVWQAYRDRSGGVDNACHTCPSHLQLDGKLPTLITRNRGLQRYLVLEFADCVSLPRSVNNIDSIVDEIAGRQAFVAAARLVLNQPDTGWLQGLEAFREDMRGLLGDMVETITRPPGPEYQASSVLNQERLDVLLAYYEGIFLTSTASIRMGNFIRQVEAEMGLP
ncbi:hypothetical protein [Rhodanobacter ginsengiterrae]|uniref:hypothetical protein n=1 Tax=Rhodanobacter ginsengiterrae TaxID=2008451 RepID=UPI003CEEA2B5